jgi:hypothetical protein
MKIRLGGTNDRTIESLRFFPYVAWFVTAGFAFFVYSIAVQLQETAVQLQMQTEFIQAQIKQNPADITDFTPPQNQP